MGRYLGPKHRVSRRFAENIGGYAKTPLGRKPYLPGQHGPTARRKKQSTYGKALLEKQKLKAYYNIREKTLLRLFELAKRAEGNTGENLVMLLERRLDNMVYRMGLALTPRCARQLVAHGHVLVDGKRVDVASYLLSPGQVVSVREKSKGHKQVQEALQHIQDLVNYVRRDAEKSEGTLIAMPKREDVPIQIEERLVVEFLSH